MSSEDEDISSRVSASASMSRDGPSMNKKRKIITRACDFCRRRKIKCDAHTDGAKCTTCTVYKENCTFVATSARRGPPKGYLAYLESRIDRLEAELKRLVPTYDIGRCIGNRLSQASWTTANQHLHPASRPTQPTKSPLAVTARSSPQEGLVNHGSLSAPRPTLHLNNSRGNHQSFSISTHQLALQTDVLESSEDEKGHVLNIDFEPLENDLAGRLSQLRLGKEPFLGKASGIHLLQQAINMKSRTTGQQEGTASSTPRVVLNRGFWGESQWGYISPPWMPPAERLTFPPQDLLNDLVALYFRWFHPFFPTLYQPTFEAQLEQATHKKDISFALQVLLVCAVASRWSEDPRVCEFIGSAAEIPTAVDWKVAGWPFFCQVIHFPLAVNRAAHLLDLQNTVLYCYFAMATKASRSLWLASGAGVRCAMDIGAHRRKSYDRDHQLQNEIWKRTFWCLVNLDRMASTGLGRPPATNDEDFDVELPIERDDRRWGKSAGQTNSSDADGPCHMQFFNHTTKLLQIATFAMRTIYSITKSRVYLGLVGEEWEQRVVSDLDSAMNNWFDTMPCHLRWDPVIEDLVLFDQSASLNIRYYHVQITIHRPFLPCSNKKASPLSHSSMTICTSAARSMSHIMDAHLKRILTSSESADSSERLTSIGPNNVGAAFLGGIVLLIAIWRLKKTGGNADVNALVMDFQKVMRYVKHAGLRLHIAGHIWDVLRDLATAGELTVDVDDHTFSSGPTQNPDQTEAKKGHLHDHGAIYDHNFHNNHETTPQIPASFAPRTSYPGSSNLGSAIRASPTALVFDPSMAGFDAAQMDIGDLLNSTLNHSDIFQLDPSVWSDSTNFKLYGLAGGDTSLTSYPASPYAAQPANGLAPTQPTYQAIFPTSDSGRTFFIPGLYQPYSCSTASFAPASGLPDQDNTPQPHALPNQSAATGLPALLPGSFLNSFLPHQPSNEPASCDPAATAIRDTTSEQLPTPSLPSSVAVDWDSWVSGEWGRQGVQDWRNIPR